MFKKLKNKATLFSILALYAFLSFSFIISPVLDSKTTSILQNDLAFSQITTSHETIQKHSGVQDLNTEFAEIEESEEDNKDEKKFDFDFIENSSYSLFSLVHQRFKNNSSYSNADKISAVPTFILLCTYRI